jgi:uncharacterized protein (DUF697 family)
VKNQPKGQNARSGRPRSRRKDGPVHPSPARSAATTSSVGSQTESPVPSPADAIDVGPIPAGPISSAAAAVAEPALLVAAPLPPIAHDANGRGLPGSRAAAEQIVKNYLPLAVAAGMVPLPGLDLAAIGGLQLKVLAALAEHYKVSFSQAQAQLIVTSLLGSVGTTVLAGAALVSIAKIIPLFGSLLGAASMPVAAGAITRAMGRLAIDHFEAGGTMESLDLDVAQKAFLEKVAEARADRI